MVFLLATTLALSFLRHLANAKSGDDTALGIAAIQAHFKNADLVPDLLPSFNPSALMTVTFPGVDPISPGQNLSMQQTATVPDVTITPANSSVQTTGNFTLVMVDSRAVGTNESNGQILHWLVNYATLKNRSSSCPSYPSLSVSTACGVVVTEYVPPQPIEGSGPHRYVILLLPQHSSFSPPANLSKPTVSIDLYFYITDYILSSHLGQPIAGMYFDVQQGPAIVTIPPTSAVITSTLSPTTPAYSA
jgi:phosphatidylethanolamine-binding protein